MAGLLLVANSGSQAVTTGPETLLQVIAGSDQRLKIRGWSFTVAGTTPIDCIVELLRQSDAGTSATSVTPVKLEPAAAETARATANTNFSVEPTPSSILEYKRLQGSYEKLYPLGQEPVVAGGARIGIRVTGTGTFAAEIHFEE